MDAPPVQYVKTSDGFNIAYSVCGSGTPLLLLFAPLIDIQSIWRMFPAWMHGLAERFRLVQFDPRGHGLSTRGLSQDTSLMQLESDLSTVVDHLDLERFHLWGWSGAASHRAVRYAYAHPERAAGLILSNPSVSTQNWGKVLWTELPRTEWDAFLSFLANVGEPPREEARRRMEIFRASFTPEDQDIWTRAIWDVSVENELKNLGVPALVMHTRNAPRVSMEESMQVAALIPGARFVVIDNAYLFGDAAQGLAAIDEFVGALPLDDRVASQTETHVDLSARELEVLRLLAEGKSNPQIAQELFITRNTVQNHVSSILTKLNLQNRAQAAVYAKEHGIV